MISQARDAGLTTEQHLKESIKPSPLAKIHNSRRSFYRVRKQYFRPVGVGVVHESVWVRWDRDLKYRPENLISISGHA